MYKKYTLFNHIQYVQHVFYVVYNNCWMEMMYVSIQDVVHMLSYFLMIQRLLNIVFHWNVYIDICKQTIHFPSFSYLRAKRLTQHRNQYPFMYVFIYVSG